jgi:carbon-monoxide dehydrogenase medium subunit
MKMSPFIYHRPTDLDEAVGLVAEFGSEGKVLAGGQSLIPLLALRLAAPRHLIDVGRLVDVPPIRLDTDGFVHVGLTARHATIESSALIAKVAPLLADATPLIGHRAIRSRGTVCGSLAHADPAAELPAVVLALNAELVIRGPGRERRVAAGDFFSGYLTTALQDDEILAEVFIPTWSSPEGRMVGWSIHEVARRHGDFAMIGVAVALEPADSGVVGGAALSYFGAGSTPRRVAEAEAILVGSLPTEDAFAEAASIASRTLSPPADDHASAAYRRHVAGVLTRRALSEASFRMRSAA